jgi:hypothetical protein
LNATGPDAVVRARIAIAGAGSGEPICAENRPRRLSLGYTRARNAKPWNSTNFFQAAARVSLKPLRGRARAASFPGRPATERLPNRAL